MRAIILLSILISNLTMAEGYYYPVPKNPPPLIYALPPAYIVPPEQSFIPPPVYLPPIQRGYHPPPPEGWGNSKLVPLPPRVNIYEDENR